MRKFTEPNQSPNVPALKKAPLRNGTGSSGQTNLCRATERFTQTAASVNTSGDSTSHTSAASQSQATPQPRGGASKPLSSASQSQNSMGGTRHPAEKDEHAYSNSKEDRTPGRAAGQQVTQEEEDPDMKTFLTIEIKDGRTTSSSTSSPQGNVVPITNMTPRITPNALGQRAGKSINLIATASAYTFAHNQFNIEKYLENRKQHFGLESTTENYIYIYILKMLFWDKLNYIEHLSFL